MNDLIKRQAAIDAIGAKSDEIYKTKLAGATFPHSDFLSGMAYATEIVQNMPSAQPEIIHCGTCKWFQYNMRPDGYLPKGVEEFECRHWCGPCDPDDFCSYAERRTNGVDN